MATRQSGTADTNRLYPLVLGLGRALSLAGTPVSETQERLIRITAAYGIRHARVVVFPTTLMIAFHGAGQTKIEPIPQRTGALRLDQISALYELVKSAEEGKLVPAEGLRGLREIGTMRPRYGRVVTVLAHAVMTAALCLILRPTLLDVTVAGCLGALVGMLVMFARDRHTLSVLVPVLSALLVSVLTFEAVGHGILEPGMRTLIAPLVTFLPGSALTTATVELASGEMIAGASRLVSGTLQMLLLAFGIVAGADLAGLPRAAALHDTYDNALGWWAPWLGVLLFGVAVAVYFSAPRGALRWLMLVLFAAWVGQLAGEHLAGTSVSGFVGALTMTPVALAVSRLPSGPPSQVTFLPAFWLLVPGAVGLIGVTEAVGNPTSGVQEFVQPFASVLAIALGVLCGASIYHGLGPRRVRRQPRR